MPGEVPGIAGGGELGGRVVLGVDLHVRRTHRHQAHSCRIGQRRPADVGALAGLAALGVERDGGIHRRGVVAHVAAPVASDVVLVRTATEPSKGLEASGNGQERPHVRDRPCRGVGRKGVVHNDVSRAVEGPRHGHGRRPRVGKSQLQVDADLGRRDRGHGGFGDHTVACGVLPLAAGARHVVSAVVVGGGPPEIGYGSFLDHLGGSQRVAGEGSLLGVEQGGEAVAGEVDQAVGLGDGEPGQFGEVDFGRSRRAEVHLELSMGDAVAGLGPGSVGLEAEIEVQVVDVAGAQCRGRERDRDVFCGKRGDVQGCRGKDPGLDGFAFLLQFPDGLVLVDVREVETVLDGKHSLGEVHSADHDARELVLDLVGFRIGDAVGVHDPVGAEIVVIGAVAPQAAVVEEVRLAAAQSLVDEVPDEAAEGPGVGVEGVDVFLHVPDAVAHGVLEFAQHDGFGIVVVGAHGVVPVVHPTVDVGVGPVAFVVDGLGGVGGVRVVAHRSEDVAVAGLVAQRPHHHAGVVLVALDHGRHPFHRGGAPGVAVFRNHIPGAVGLEVRLVDHVDAVLVAQLVHARIVGIVRHAKRVDVQPLHEKHVFFHALVGHHVAQIRIDLVAVDAPELDGLVVYVIAREPRRVLLELHLAEADLVALVLHHRASGILEGQNQRVQVGLFTRPQCRGGHGHLERDLRFPSRTGNGGHRLGGGGAHLLASSVEQQHVHRVARGGGGGGVLHPHGGLEVAVLVVGGQIRVDLEVLDVGLGGGEQVHVAVDAGKPDEVLVFHPRSVAPAEHLHGDVVGAGTQFVRHVELVAGEGVFAVSHVFAVHPHVVGGFHAFEVQADAASVPGGGDGELAAVVAHRIEVLRGGRRRDVVASRPGIGHIGVDGTVVALLLPGTRHRDVLPGAHIVAVLEEGGVAAGGFFHMEELPGAGQGLVPAGGPALAGLRLVQRGVGHGGGVGFEDVHPKHGRCVVPFLGLRPGCVRQHRNQGQAGSHNRFGWTKPETSSKEDGTMHAVTPAAIGHDMTTLGSSPPEWIRAPVFTCMALRELQRHHRQNGNRRTGDRGLSRLGSIDSCQFLPLPCLDRWDRSRGRRSHWNAD